MLLYYYGMNEINKISISMNPDTIKLINEYVKEQQKINLEKNDPLTNRSKEIERIIKTSIISINS